MVLLKKRLRVNQKGSRAAPVYRFAVAGKQASTPVWKRL
jgi:hypothetical protein